MPKHPDPIKDNDLAFAQAKANAKLRSAEAAAKAPLADGLVAGKDIYGEGPAGGVGPKVDELR